MSKEEIKLRFFALYLGAGVSVTNSKLNNNISYIGDLHAIYRHSLLYVKGGKLESLYAERPENCKLQLKPLYAITDEEVIDYLKNYTNEDIVAVQNISKLQWKVIYSDRMNDLVFDISEVIPVNVADYLRSKRYLISTTFLGIAVLAEGWVELK